LFSFVVAYTRKNLYGGNLKVHAAILLFACMTAYFGERAEAPIVAIQVALYKKENKR
jgi:hypothetical protein